MTAEVLVSPLLSKETPVRNFNEDQLNPTCSAKPSMPDAEADTHYSLLVLMFWILDSK
jgi:hypothetical protein